MPAPLGAQVMTWVSGHDLLPETSKDGVQTSPQPAPGHRTLTDITNEGFGSTPGKAFVTPGGGRGPRAGRLDHSLVPPGASPPPSAEVMQRQKQMQMMLDNSLISPAEFKTMVSRLRAESHLTPVKPDEASPGARSSPAAQPRAALTVPLAACPVVVLSAGSCSRNPS